MTNEDGTLAPAPAAPRRDVASGAVIAVSALATAALMTQHPSMGRHETREALFAEAVRIAAKTEFVHAGMLIAMGALVFGFLGLARGLGPERPFVRLGVVAYILGALGGGGAAVLNGLVFPGMARHFVDRTPAEMEIAGTVLTFSHMLSNSLAAMGLIAWSAAVFSWSLAIVGYGGAWKWIAIFGFVIGAGPAAMFLGGHLRLDVHGFGLFIFGQALWSVAVGIRLALPGSSGRP